MAEEFVIRIDTGKGTGGRQASGDGASAIGIGAVAGLGTKQSQFSKPDTFRFSERMTKENIQMNKEEGFNLTGSKLHSFGTMREMKWDSDKEGPGSTYQQTAFGVGVEKGANFVSDNKRLLIGGGVAAAYKASNVAMQQRAHRSGNQYQNQKEANSMRMAQYGVAIAMSGPKAPLMIAGIAINEGVNAYQGAQTYGFDRKMEMMAIENSRAVAGDISYGRKRGVGR